MGAGNQAKLDQQMKLYDQAIADAAGSEAFYALNAGRGGSISGTNTGSSLENQQTYEDWRQKLLAELTAPRDWITRWQVANTPNPYQVQPQSHAGEELTGRQQGLQYWQNVLSAAQTNPNVLNHYGMQLGDVYGAIDYYQGEINRLGEQQYVQQHAGETWGVVGQSALYNEQGNPILDANGNPVNETGINSVQGNRNPIYGMQPAPPSEEVAYSGGGGGVSTPPAPAWLPQYVPGLTGGSPITRQYVPTPSGQQINAMPWSNAQALSGYAEYAGGRPWEDILAHAQMMQPYAPSRTNNVSWRPASQRRV
jgi:hypothetical protein